MEDGNELLNFLVDDLKAIHGHLDLRVTDLHLLQPLGLLFQLILNLFEVFYFVCNLGPARDFIGMAGFELFDDLAHSLLVEVYQTHMLLKVLQLLINPLLFHFEAVIVFQFNQGSVRLYLVNQGLELAVDLLDVFDSADFHAVEQGVAVLNELFGATAVLFKLTNDVLTIFF